MYKSVICIALLLCSYTHIIAQNNHLLIDNISKILYFGDNSNTAIESLKSFSEEVPDVNNYATILQHKSIDRNDSVYNSTISHVKEYARLKYGEKGDSYIRLLLSETIQKINTCPDVSLLDHNFELLHNAIDASGFDSEKAYKWHAIITGIKLRNLKFGQGELQLTHLYETIWEYIETHHEDTSLEYSLLCSWIISLLSQGDIEPLADFSQIYNNAKSIYSHHGLIGTSGDYCLDLNYYAALSIWGNTSEAQTISSLIDNATKTFGENNSDVAWGYSKLSLLNFVQGYNHLALSYMEKSKEILTRIYSEGHNSHQFIIAYLACLYISAGAEYKENGIKLYEKATDLVKKHHGNTSDVYFDIIFSTALSYGCNQPQTAIKITTDLADELLAVVSTKDFSKINRLKSAILLRQTSDYLFNLQQHEKANLLIEHSIDLLSDLPDQELELAQSLLYKANFKSSTLKYNDAADLFIKVAKICHKHKYEKMAFSSYCNAADQHRYNNDSSETAKIIRIIEKHFPDALNTFEYLTTKSFSLINENPDQAIEYTNRALSLSQAEDNTLKEASCYSYLGYIYHNFKNNNDEALKFYNKSLKIYQTFNENFFINELITLYLELSTVYHSLSDLNNSQKYLLECIRLCEQNELVFSNLYFDALIHAVNRNKAFDNITGIILYASKAFSVANNIFSISHDEDTAAHILTQILPLCIYMYSFAISHPDLALHHNIDLNAYNTSLSSLFKVLEEYFNKHDISDYTYLSIKYHIAEYYLLTQNYEAANAELNELISIIPAHEPVLKSEALTLRADLNSVQQKWDLVIPDLLLLCQNRKNNPIAYSNILHHLGHAYLQNAEHNNAIDCAKERFLLNRDFIGSKFHTFTSLEREAISTHTSLTNPSDFYTLLHYSNTPEVCALSYDAALYYKGLRTYTEKSIRNSIISSNDSSLISDYNRMIELRHEYFLIANKTDSISSRRQLELNEEELIIDNRIAEKSAEYKIRKDKKHETWQDVLKKLNDDEVAIEMIQYPFQVNDSTIDLQYGALILRNTYKTPIYVPLMTCSTLDSLREHKSGSEEQHINKTYRRTTLATSPRNGETLYNGLWAPLEKHLSGISKIYYSPIGHLYTVAFSALEDSTGMVLGEKYDLRMVTNTAQIINPDYFNNDKIISASIIGGIIYDADSTKQSIRNRNWKELDFSFVEMAHLPSSIRSYGLTTDSIAGLDASENAFRNLKHSSNNIIHLSTHGFYRDSTLTEWAYIYPQTKSNQLSPMHRSALVMADANPVWNGEESRSQNNDGILTAAEIAELDLSKTSIVLLGACETGLGMPDMNEGVGGLQRGFKLAGAQTIIMSLWSVNDKAESEFVSIFYEKLFKLGLEKHIAFREAQLELKRKYPKNPFKWAYFVMLD